MNYCVVRKNELEHSGVIGMKWGIRRYQNKDGTLTAEGRKRYKKKRHYGEVPQSQPPERTLSEIESETTMLRAQKNNLEVKRQLNEEVNRNTPTKPDGFAKKVVKRLGPVLAKSLTDALGTVARDAVVHYLKKALNVPVSNDKKKKNSNENADADLSKQTKMIVDEIKKQIGKEKKNQNKQPKQKEQKQKEQKKIDKTIDDPNPDWDELLKRFE